MILVVYKALNGSPSLYIYNRPLSSCRIAKYSKNELHKSDAAFCMYAPGLELDNC